MGDCCEETRYRKIDPEKLIQTVAKLSGRVNRVFPESGLSCVAREVLAVSEGTVERVNEIKKPRWKLRVGIWVVVLLAVLGPFLFSFLLSFSQKVENLGDFLQATDAGLHLVLILAGAVAFLIGMESRMRRNEALEALSEFRSLAHLVDLHQINKDPGIDQRSVPVPDERTVKSDMELGEYLDIAGDLLSIIGKLAAFYAQNLSDRVVLDAVTEIETLSSSLSHQLWLKILVLNEVTGGLAPLELPKLVRKGS